MTDDQPLPMNIYAQHGITGRIRTIPRGTLKILQTEHWSWHEITEAEAHADARYVRNDSGSVHSVPSADLADILSLHGMEQVTEEEARAAAPDLFGKGER